MYSKYFIFLCLMASLFSSNFKYVDPPINSSNATRSKETLDNKNLGLLLGLKMQIDEAFYDITNELSDLATRQLSNAPDLYEKNVASVVFIGAGSDRGTGIIIGENEIITNYHVVSGFENVDFVLYDSNITSKKQIIETDIYSAEVFGFDDKRDLALLKTKKSLNNFVDFGRNWSIKVAQDVFAIGHPAGLWSFTYGVISSLPKNKEWSYDGEHSFVANCIQTQTPINPGNSGGPLFNSRGQLIGINAYTSDGEGLNFAIRIDEVTDFIEKSKKGEYPKGQQKPDPPWDLILDHKFKDVNKVYGQDSNLDGQYDSWKIYEDNDNEVDTQIYDYNFDGEVDIIHGINDGVFILDTNYDTIFDTIGVDTDNDGLPDEFDDFAAE